MFVKKRNPFIKNQKAEFLSLNVQRRREDEEKFSQFFVFFYFFILKGKLLKLEIQRVTYIKDEAEFDVPILSTHTINTQIAYFSGSLGKL